MTIAYNRVYLLARTETPLTYNPQATTPCYIEMEPTMATKPATKTKPVTTAATARAKAVPMAKNVKPAADKAKKVSTKAAETKAVAKPEVALLAPNTFAKFAGYVSEVAENEQDFAKGDTLYVIGVVAAEGENPTMYEVIPASQVPAFIADPEDENIEGSQLVVQEVAALGGKALNDAKEAFLPIPSIGKLDSIIEEADGDLLEAARGLFSDLEENSFYLGGVLAKVRREGSHLKENGGDFEGDAAWDEFCQGEFGFGGAKGGDLARQYTTFAAIPEFDPSSLADIGWSKLREIQRYVTEDNVDELLDTAKNSTKRELSVKLVEKFASEDNKTAAGKSATRGGGSASVKMLALTLKLPEESHTAVTMALTEAKKVYGVNTDAEALERIIVAWADEHVQSATKKKQITSKVDKAATGVKKAPVGKVKTAA